MPRRSDTRAIRRGKASLAPKAVILIVCEGEKTEPNYFAYYKRSLRLLNVTLEICGKECGTDPVSVVEYAKKRFRKDSSIDVCFCIVDRDKHDDRVMMKAVDIARSTSTSARKFSLHISDPCIEYWFILHFEYCRTPFVQKGSKSRADCAAERLNELMSGGYTKNDPEIGDKLAHLQGIAAENAGMSIKDAEETGEPNPSTTLHLVMNELQSLKSN